MRMRNKPWAGPELDACPFFIRRPADMLGKWHSWFTKTQPIHLELGCGKGWFLAELAPKHPEINYVGIDLMDERDSVDRIYINFCNPWPKPRHYKRRLTYPTRLMDYRKLMRPGAELWFKTDDMPLYKDTLRYLEESGYRILWQTEDLHNAEDAEEDMRAMTEHEKMFSEKGIRIKALRAIPE